MNLVYVILDSLFNVGSDALKWQIISSTEEQKASSSQYSNLHQNTAILCGRTPKFILILRRYQISEICYGSLSINSFLSASLNYMQCILCKIE